MTKTKWTEEQLKAIKLTGHNIIVSAGAGSGKTAVLTERVCEHLRNNYHINELLILTFTKAAASEMKERIRKALKLMNNHEELALIDSAYISTFDSFALGIVKRYHYYLNVTNDVAICPESLIKIITMKAIDEVFEDKYQQQDKAFMTLISDFVLKNDDELKKIIYYYHEKFNQYVDKSVILDNYEQMFLNDQLIDQLINKYYEIIKEKIINLDSLFNNLLRESSENTYRLIFNLWQAVKDGKTLEDKILALQKPLAKKARNQDGEGFSDARKKLKDAITEINDSYNARNYISMKQEISDITLNVLCIVDILKAVEQKITIIKEKNELFTFYDIAKLAIKVVKENPLVQMELKNEFKEIMIDEYQDTSDIQETLINLISNHNVYMVGDIKQSIYGFRNANPALFEQKYEEFTDYKELVNVDDSNIKGIKIDLVKNFRSRKEVVDIINDIFTRLMDKKIGGVDYLKGHQMIQGNHVYDEVPDINLYLPELLDYQALSQDDASNFSKAEKEAFIIVNDIINKLKYLEIYDKEQKLYRKAEYQDFVILCERERDFSIFKQVFEYFKVPLSLLKDENLISGMNIRIIKNLLKFIYLCYNKNYNNEFVYLYVSLARSFLFECSDQEIYQTIKKQEINKTLIFKLANNIANKIEVTTLTELLDLVINDFAFINKINKVGELDKFQMELNFIKTLIKSSNNLAEYLDFLEKAIDEDLDLKYNANIGGMNTVRLMNIHKSKGLEFPICYYMGLSSIFNEEDIKKTFVFDHQTGIIIPYIRNGKRDTFLKEISIYNYKYQNISEKIRLFYVALTRTKEKLIIVDETTTLNNIINNPKQKIKYRSFQDFMLPLYKQTKILMNLVNKKDLNLSSEYQINKQSNVTDVISNYQNIEKIIINDLNEMVELDYQKSNENRGYSKKIYVLDNEAIKLKKSYGTLVHEALELINIDNFYNIDELPIDQKIKDMIKKMQTEPLFIKKYLNYYHEYEFIDDGKHGIIDLLLEDENEFIIVDYKLKNIDDEAYNEQLKGYANYLKKHTTKKITAYLYSLLEGKLQKVGII